ncbi:hypothetical protein NLM33_49160 (plasmid) [Bradyrhizobium sp. CCGUVB1N3]|uniref:hypothetical protein n=1 Tax=Bradyrhizobium sp. CCGUVB1N3 TaxID=2949629 RepID=UPI0020B213AD|nr:hypothetical protein [Bradyrhizobium sp. CCGUVB1N3]MCP3478026.1 hypothetical protein [Bradyrhizobium sp. CCGUVB1N3]
MDFLKDFFDAVVQVITIITSSSSTASLSAIGAILLLLTAVLAYVALKTPPEKISRWVWVALFFSLVGGMGFSAAGPGLALFYVSQNTIKRMDSQLAIKHLEENAEVNYLVRLVPYDPVSGAALALERIENLGPKEQVYSFVASYDELVGYTASEAVRKVGGLFKPGNHISAVIFPLLGQQLYPANARGLLQVISDVEQRKDIPEIKERFLVGGRSLTKEDKDELKSTDEYAYQLKNFVTQYAHYCELAYTFKCDQNNLYSARTYIGGLSRDWHPLGFSQMKLDSDPCAKPVKAYCEFDDWKKMASLDKKDFGARVFLIRNLEIAKIPGRILLDFDKPSEQLIPDIGTR